MRGKAWFLAAWLLTHFKHMPTYPLLALA